MYWRCSGFRPKLLARRKLQQSGLVDSLICLASGAVGGNIAGALMKDKSLGTLWNSVVGILGGGLGGQSSR